MLLLGFQFHVAIMIGFNLFSLILHAPIELVAVVIHHHHDILLVLPFHFASSRFDFLHSVLSVLLPFFNFPHQVLAALQEPLSLGF